MASNDKNSVLSTANDTVVSLPHEGTAFPAKSTTTHDIQPKELSKFQKFQLKCQPLMLYVVSMAQFLDIVSGASMTVAMLPIARDLNFAVQDQQWLISAYALSFGGLLTMTIDIYPDNSLIPHRDHGCNQPSNALPTTHIHPPTTHGASILLYTAHLLLIAGRMGDLFGHRRIFLAGLAWFCLWSTVNGFSRSPVMLCVSRALQGMGAAAQIPTALALIAIKYPVGQERTRALSIFGAIGAMGAVTGLLLSGALTSTIGWQWIFFICAILSFILLVVGIFALPDAPGLHGVNPKVDIGGSFTATGGIVCVIYYISAGVETGWASVKTLPVLCAGLVLLAVFFVIEKRISYPIMPFHIWKHRAFSASFAIIFVMQASFQGFLYYSTLIFQEVLGYSIMRTSLSYLVHGLTAIVVYSILGRFLPRLPLKPFICLGFIFLAGSSLLFAFVTPTSTYWILPFLGLICNVFGLGFVMLPAQITALRDAADDDQGVVGAIYNVGLQIGAPMGLAILTVISGNVNGAHDSIMSGADQMKGYKMALFGDAAFGALGLILTLVFLPHVKPGMASKAEDRAVEQGGVAATENIGDKEEIEDVKDNVYGDKEEIEDGKHVYMDQELAQKEMEVGAKTRFA
ncbi:hypothetical protein MVEG_11259 [Podila verticillata NRRL 6337]|uniref:Major facilitator superfamily (MFS) profile domain-containing protein n=1 Tax=Podila verticillata NRRL 6337 TaxID=1069443 RepID=A0A086TLA5_9FUNG|nr:hypothetical protein MVEG_11259 [Podila verticillata NRRL 6337]